MLLQLNDDCLQCVFQRMSFESVLNVAVTCRHLYDVAGASLRDIHDAICVHPPLIDCMALVAYLNAVKASMQTVSPVWQTLMVQAVLRHLRQQGAALLTRPTLSFFDDDGSWCAAVWTHFRDGLLSICTPMQRRAIAAMDTWPRSMKLFAVRQKSFWAPCRVEYANDQPDHCVGVQIVFQQPSDDTVVENRFHIQCAHDGTTCVDFSVLFDSDSDTELVCNPDCHCVWGVRAQDEPCVCGTPESPCQAAPLDLPALAHCWVGVFTFGYFCHHVRAEWSSHQHCQCIGDSCPFPDNVYEPGWTQAIATFAAIILDPRHGAQILPAAQLAHAQQQQAELHVDVEARIRRRPKKYYSLDDLPTDARTTDLMPSALRFL
jgi:hypothetical protein